MSTHLDAVVAATERDAQAPAPGADELAISGVMLAGYAQACLNLGIVAGRRASSLTRAIDMMAWYPFERLRELERLVVEGYADAAPILERVGMAMMLGWYHHGPGRQIISGGIDFLRFQSGSQGYASVCRGPEAQVGAFRLVSLDEAAGTALVHSTTPFEKNLERGVIIGGMMAPGDLDYIDVDNSDDPALIHVEFH